MEKPMPDAPNVNPWNAPAAELLQSHCRQVEAYALPVDAADETPAAIRRAAAPAPPATAPLTRADLPPEMQSLIARYEASHPGTHLEPLRYVSTGFPDAGTAGTGDLFDGDVVSLSATETIIDADQIQVASRVIIARRTAARYEAPRG
jgi:hypothetical protein